MTRNEAVVDLDVRVPVGTALLEGHLHLPSPCEGIVVFAHGSGSSRHSPRNRFVAEVLNEAGLGTLLLDLLTPQEEGSRRNVFDIDLLAPRVGAAVRWLHGRSETAGLPIGLFGASTGSAAALRAAADPDLEIAAVVSRGGRPDLADAWLGEVSAPTLLVVGGDDESVLGLNRMAATRLGGTRRVAVVPGATHLFEEPGTLAQAAHLARDWFVEHLVTARIARAEPRLDR